MQRFKAILGYTAAVLTIAAAVIGPLFWFGFFERLTASSGLRIDPVYTGGEPAQVLHRKGDRGAYDVIVYRPVARRAPLAAGGEFLQVVWKPASSLPATVREQIDFEPGGRPGFIATFDCPRDKQAPLRLDVTPLSPRVLALQGIGRGDFTRLIARVNDTIVIRVPLP
jgi:hypothetical protein